MGILQYIILTKSSNLEGKYIFTKASVKQSLDQIRLQIQKQALCTS